ncbi:hypothetical protein FRC05_004102 [Tulasnella sp. 425]|nr:hypothetical protein FRC05_004102 [Tulasnella sp. 425]
MCRRRRLVPALETKLGAESMADNIVGHESFKAPVAEFIASLRAKEKTWDPEVFRQAAYAFIPVLREHLVDEIDTFRPHQLKGYFTKEELDEFERDMTAWLMARSSPENRLPFYIANGDAVNGPW